MDVRAWLPPGLLFRYVCGMEMFHVNHSTLSPADSIISANSLTRVYPIGESGVAGLRGVDLRVPAGAMVVLKGASGSGKSTLLALLAGLDRPTSGSLRVAGVDLVNAGEAELTDFRRRIVGMVFQSFNLMPTMNVLENVLLPALLAGRDERASRGRAMELLDWLGMAPRVGHSPAQLSGGEMQRTAIARALINDPAIILADEPTGNLDSESSHAVVALLAELNRIMGRTVIVATHANLADPYATLRLLLTDGRLTQPVAD